MHYTILAKYVIIEEEGERELLSESRISNTTRFLRIFLWEFTQNLPIVTGVLLSLQLWQQGRWGMAVLAAVSGSTIGSLLIYWTEAKIVENHHEPIRVIITNIFLMSSLICAIIAYLSTEWGNWFIDGIIGSSAGVILGTMQSLAGEERISITHCLAFSVAFAITLISIRWLTPALPIALNLLVVNIIVTLLITLIDYRRIYASRGD